LKQLSLSPTSTLQLISGEHAGGEDSTQEKEKEEEVEEEATGADSIRFDVRSPVTLFINDMEKDKKYQTWPATLRIVGDSSIHLSSLEVHYSSTHTDHISFSSILQ
jgi:hypothetical protein